MYPKSLPNQLKYLNLDFNLIFLKQAEESKLSAIPLSLIILLNIFLIQQKHIKLLIHFQFKKFRKVYKQKVFI